MRIVAALAAGIIASGLQCAAPKAAEPAPPSYQASPDSYKVLSENDQFIVIATTRAPGTRDKWHSHKAAAVYWLTDCDQMVYTPDGKVTESKNPAGFVRLQPPIESHSTENIGPAECRQLIVERKQ